MKKRLFLALIPALMALSSCNAISKQGITPRQDNTVKETEFLEDTEAHDEIFGKAGFGGINSGIRKISNIEYDPPAIGIQSMIDDKGDADSSNDTISVRFVAAVDFGSTVEAATAKWHRTMFGTDGHVLDGRVETEKPCSKAYTSLADPEEDGGVYTIDNLNGSTYHYTHFVVYTMTGIPLETYANCYLTAYLTVDADGEGAGEAVTSKVVATTVDQKTQLSFNKNDTGCFGVKITGLGYETFSKANSTKEGYWATFANVTLDGGDWFLFANRAIDLGDRNNDFFAVYGFDKLREGDHAYEGHPNGFYEFTQAGDSQFSVCPRDMQKYYFYVQNDTNKIFPKYSITKTVELVLGANWKEALARYAVYISDTGFGSEGWYPMTTVTSNERYSYTLTNVPDCATFIFVRLNPDNDELNWNSGVKWNQSGDCDPLSTGNNVYTTSGWDYSGSWGEA